MIVITPHQDDELKIINIQNKVLQALKPFHIYIETNPLWPILEVTSCEDIKKLKELGKTIKEISIPSLYFEHNIVMIKCIIKKEGKVQDCSFPIASPYLEKNNEKELNLNEEEINKELKKIAEETLPLSLKIFKIGNTNSPTNNSICLSNFCWVKLK